MSQNKVLGGQIKIGKQNSNFSFSTGDTYFVNLNIVNTSKGVNENQIENLENANKQRIVEYQKFRASRANQEFSENYVTSTTAQLSRRDRIPGNNESSGSFTEINPIINKSISRVLIYGSPGTGKTTLCKKIVHEFYSKGIWTHLDEVIWIPLRQLKDSKFDAEDLNEKKLLEILLGKENLNLNLENVLFILDGWDEIQDLLENPKKIKLVETIHKIRGRKNVILTSRPYVQLNFADYQRVLEITGFSTQNVRDYIKAVLKQNNRIDEEGKIVEYINSVLLSDLVTIPIILEIFLYTWKELSVLDVNEITTTKLYETFFLKLTKIYISECGKNVHEDLSLKDAITGPLLKEFTTLKAMARNWLKTGSLQFIYNEFCKQNEDCNIKIPFLNFSSNNGWKTESSEFIHLTFLEFFAALELINLNKDEFRVFVTENKFNPKYFVVLTFATGLINADLHNLTEFGSFTYRYTKEEKLELFFDYLQSDPIDLTGKYIYMLLIDCMNECQPSKSRELSIYKEIVAFSKQSDYYNGIDGGAIFKALRRFPLGLFDEFLKGGEGNLNSLSYSDIKFPQLTDSMVKTIYTSGELGENAKLEILCNQISFSSYSAEIILKLMNFTFLQDRSSSTYSNFPLPVLQKILKLIINKHLFPNGDRAKSFPTLTGISPENALELCKQLVKIENEDSVHDIIVKLILAEDVNVDSLFFLRNVHEFMEEVPGALLKVLNDPSTSPQIAKRAIELRFNDDSAPLVQKLIEIVNSKNDLKYISLRTLGDIYKNTEMPHFIAEHILENFKTLLNAEKERLSLRNKLVQDYFNQEDRKSKVDNIGGNWKINQDTMSVKEFIQILECQYGSTIVNLAIELFLGANVSDLPNEILQNYGKFVMKILPFIVESKAPDGNLHLKKAIANIINSKEDCLIEMFGVFHVQLIHETVKDVLQDLLSQERNSEWKLKMRRICYTLTESQRYCQYRYIASPKGYPKHPDQKCVEHFELIPYNLLSLILEDNTKSKINKAEEENLLETLIYICYEGNSNDVTLLETLARCGVEDSEYQEKQTEHLIELFQQDLEQELRAEIVTHFPERVNRMTKEQLSILLKYVGEDEVYELNEHSNEDRSYLSTLSKWAQDATLVIHKFIKDSEYFSEEEQSEFRNLNQSYKAYYLEETDLSIEKKVNEFESLVKETLELSSTKEIINAIASFFKDQDINEFEGKCRNVDSELYGYGLLRIYYRAAKFFPSDYRKQFVNAFFILDQYRQKDFKKLNNFKEKLGNKTLSQEIIQKIYEKFDDDELGIYFLLVLEYNSKTSIPAMLKCIDGSSSEKQKVFITYILINKLIDIDDNIPLYIFNNDLHMGNSAFENPIISDLNEYQLECIFNAKSFANSNGFNIQMHGIAQNIESFQHCMQKCTIAELTDNEKFLKSVKHLDLSKNNIKDIKEIEKVCNFVKKYPVETLNLSNNQITGGIFEKLLQDSHETHLKHLILNTNLIDMGSLDFELIFGNDDSYLRQNGSLKLLDFSNNSNFEVIKNKLENLQGAEKFQRKNREGKTTVDGYIINSTNIIL